jgi:hypothetical protein
MRPTLNMKCFWMVFDLGVYTADEEQGEVVCAALDALGQPIAREGELVKVRLTGKVEIKPRASDANAENASPSA